MIFSRIDKHFAHTHTHTHTVYIRTLLDFPHVTRHILHCWCVEDKDKAGHSVGARSYKYIYIVHTHIYIYMCVCYVERVYRSDPGGRCVPINHVIIAGQTS